MTGYTVSSLLLFSMFLFIYSFIQFSAKCCSLDTVHHSSLNHSWHHYRFPSDARLSFVCLNWPQLLQRYELMHLAVPVWILRSHMHKNSKTKKKTAGVALISHAVIMTWSYIPYITPTLLGMSSLKPGRLQRQSKRWFLAVLELTNVGVLLLLLLLLLFIISLESIFHVDSILSANLCTVRGHLKAAGQHTINKWHHWPPPCYLSRKANTS